MRPRTFSDQELLETARRCFLERGPGVSTGVIAAELGVSQAAVFKRFPTKQALMLRALAPPAKPGWVEELERGPDERPVKEQLRAHLGRIDAFFSEIIPCMAVLSAAGFEKKDVCASYDEPPPVKAHRALSTWLEALEAQRRTDLPSPRSAATIILGALQARHMLRYMLGPAAPATSPNYLDDIVDLLWRGMQPLAVRSE
ncbi:MAG: TetR/AcrR family transcriptional regulator [Nannocystaceae bacterium]